MTKTFRANRLAAAAGIALLLGVGLSGCQATANSNTPKGLPAAVVTVQGEVSNEASPDKNNWSYTVEVADEKAQKEAITKLKDNGFTVLGEAEADGRKTYSLTNEKEKINATVVLAKEGKKFLVIYNVIKL
ncbi:hypothetical protein G7068_11670 [Leucobacter viscericola]|uniref:Lipoprotein n=1 Tax=Leucobacter viscericola TaxID=2714935 RepID=A0A6G7XGN5_9MICO|nr:hypothetical protein [Leucobacter viscericola]QIK63770.1 hypothetical protein G7068_11670 [Leucobacter viscericola]